MRNALSACLLLALTSSLVEAADPAPRRLALQTAIERARWEQRIWPGANPNSKPRFEQAVPPASIQRKVDASLRAIGALESQWSVRIDRDAVQGEIRRLVRDTQDPAGLKRIFDALHGSPVDIAEGLALPTLADRLARRYYANDERLHAATRRRAEETLANVRSGVSAATDAPVIANYSRENDDAWRTAIERTRSGIVESDEAFEASVVLSRSADEVRVAEWRWEKTPFDVWLASQPLPKADHVVALRAGDITLPTFDPDAPCAPDTWRPTPRAPTGRERHTAVWTGSEMILFGGRAPAFDSSSTGYLPDGYRYDPATDTWTPTRRQGAPTPRYGHTAVWTGSKMIVWGGSYGANPWQNVLADGAIYDPVTDTWAPMSATTLAPRSGHTAVWTGTAMIVWGGYEPVVGNSPATGASYDPANDTWTPIANGPLARYEHTAVWTGTAMMVWGGWTYWDGQSSTGGLYVPATNSWTSTALTNAPAPRNLHTMVWTGTRAIVWGGSSSASPAEQFGTLTGGSYDPSTNSWQATSTVNAPSARYRHVAVWSGNRMIVWAGFGNAGRYDPATDSWSPAATLNQPPSTTFGTAVWTGSEMLAWGGSANSHRGGRYNPATDTWLPTYDGGAPSPRSSVTATFTGAEVVVWGGSPNNFSSAVQTGARYDLATDTWTPTSTVNAPLGRVQHTAVWSGSRVIVWGGQSSGGAVESSGGRYDPVSNTWAATSLVNAPAARTEQSAVWAGGRMVIWGGWPTHNPVFGDGGRYDPAADAWTPISFENAPEARHAHSTADAGNTMYVWGGAGGAGGTSVLNSGAKYDAVANVWTPLPPGPVGGGSGAVWTGTDLIVPFGMGSNYGGVIYRSASETWSVLSTVNALNASGSAVAWDGSRMLVWGGTAFPQVTAADPNLPTDAGSFYDPASDTWTWTSLEKAPTPRRGFGSTWLGTRLFVFGGSSGATMSSGGVYCPGCAGVFTHYRDRDGDGHGDAADSLVSCVSIPGDGYAADATDCDDANAAFWSAPGEPPLLAFGADKASLSWDEPVDPGGVAAGLVYDTIRSGSPASFVAATCIESNDGPNRVASDAAALAPGQGYYYLVRAGNACGEGSLGAGSGGAPRVGAACP